MAKKKEAKRKSKNIKLTIGKVFVRVSDSRIWKVTGRRVVNDRMVIDLVNPLDNGPNSEISTIGVGEDIQLVKII